MKRFLFDFTFIGAISQSELVFMRVFTTLLFIYFYSSVIFALGLIGKKKKNEKKNLAQIEAAQVCKWRRRVNKRTNGWQFVAWLCCSSSFSRTVTHLHLHKRTHSYKLCEYWTLFFLALQFITKFPTQNPCAKRLSLKWVFNCWYLKDFRISLLLLLPGGFHFEK